MLRFEWDPSKDRANIKKHGVSFTEASSIFHDPTTLVASDMEHSRDESRFIAVGFSVLHRLLLVAHCYRAGDEVIRVISARKTTPRERRQFEEGL